MIPVELSQLVRGRAVHPKQVAAQRQAIRHIREIALVDVESRCVERTHNREDLRIAWFYGNARIGGGIIILRTRVGRLQQENGGGTNQSKPACVRMPATKQTVKLLGLICAPLR